MRKNLFLIIATFLFSAAAIAQIPHLFKYQGLARDSSGTPISNDTIALRISIHQGTPTGTVVYQETHNPMTNEFGSFSIDIGGGTVVTGNFSTIPWSRYNYFQEVEMDITGHTSFVSMGASQYLSVPYSFSSDSAFYSFRSLLADSSIRSFHAFKSDSALFGIAPFRVSNSLNDNTEASVAIIASANTTDDGAPAIWARNLGTGPALLVDGHSILSGHVKVEGDLDVTQTITANGLSGTTGQVLGANQSGDLVWLNVARGFSNYYIFNSSGTFTVPVGVTKLMVELWGSGGGGGGGGGGRSDSLPASGGTGGGGGGGAYRKETFNVNPGDWFSVVIGIGGIGGTEGSQGSASGSNGTQGSSGQNTSFGIQTLFGGVGGEGGYGGSSNGNGNGGLGGAGANAPGLITISGQSGFGGTNFGFGGSSPNGGFGKNPGGDNTPGGGGSGGQGQFGNGNAGTSGGNGRVVVWW